MTAHVVYTALDARQPATTSALVIDRIIRGEIGFTDPLISDDLSMKALSGGMRQRTESALTAGCDLVLHCNGEMAEMTEIAAVCPPVTESAAERLTKASAGLPKAPSADLDLLHQRLDKLLSVTIEARS